MRRIVGEFWFTQGMEPPLMGVVVTEDPITKERFAYMGTTSEGNPCGDIESIRTSGAKFQLHDIKAILDLMEKRADRMTDHDHSEGVGKCTEAQK